MPLRALAAACGLLLALLAAAPAQADTFVVNTTADTVGAVGCPQVCTIRSAISAAAGNGNAVDDVIEVPAGTYTLNPQLGALAIPNAATRITLHGAGANTTFIQPSIEFAMRVLSVGTNAGLTISDITVRNGRVTAANEYGGNVLAQSGSTLTLARARVTGGRALRGGGIATRGAASLSVSASLIDGNSATATALNDSGGGIHVEGQTSATVVTIQDSTITGNRARNGGGIGVANNTGQNPALRGVTLTRNVAYAGAGGAGAGGIASSFTTARFQGSIVGGNLGEVNVGSATQQFAANCALQGAPIDEGGNVSFDAGEPCGLGGVHDDPRLAAALDGSQPPVLALPADSSAVDIAACAGRTFDQRGVLRPQGLTCDAGAYEYQAPVIEPTPTPTPAPTSTPTPTPTATPTSVPTPVANRSVGVQPSGRVLAKLPGAKGFVPLSEGVLPNGAEVDTREGSVLITRSDGGRARFFDGIFRIGHSGAITTLTLTEALAPCPKRASAAAQTRKPKTRRLWGDGKGKFRTKGRYSAATVRGTKWLVQDGCRYTLTRVAQGSVLVRDQVRKKNVIVRKGKRYIARPRR